MKYSLSLLIIGDLILSVPSYAVDVIPKRSDFSRYQVLLERSPFAVATAAVAAAPTPSAFKDLYIANAAKSPEGDLVTLASSSDKNFKEYLSTKEPNPHGYGIASIEWSEKVGQTRVTISKDGQFGTVTFNQALISEPRPSAGGAPPPQVPTMIPPPPVQTPMPNLPVAKPAIPTLPTPPPRVRGVIPRNPNAAATAAAPAPAVVQTPAPSDDDE